MALTTPTSNGSHRLTPPSPHGNGTSRSVGVRPTLPHRGVTNATIEEAYVSFILYCNPAVSLDVDTTALREAFRTPPKSEGKSFSTFTLFELIRKLHDKEIKTWAELALKLGVEPPDQDKGQSTQKIQQYAVRLKRWMHSMHVDAFFDYLLDNAHTYWTHVPTTPNPVCESGRDGVAAEDDMALRALLPHIRPRRGRKRPEEDGLSKSPSQRPRLDSPNYNGENRQSRPDVIDPWTAHPDGRNAFVFPPVDPRSSVMSGPDSAYLWHNDSNREPMSAYPQSAMTPSTRGVFWPDPTEPRSAISPPKGKSFNRRHGAKVVSSAWRSSGTPTAGKARGRPPMNRMNESPMSAFPSDRKDFPADWPDQCTPQSNTTPVPMFPPGPMARPTEPISEPSSAHTVRPNRPGRLSLQVPERAGGPVRLATPPPPQVMVNGKATANGNENFNENSQTERTDSSATEDAFTVFDRSSAMFASGAPEDQGSAKPFTLDGEDTTNYSEIQGLFVAEIMDAKWLDEHGNPGPPASVEEVIALAQTVIRGVSHQALTKEAFLINIALLAGGTVLLKGSTANTVQRIEIGADYTKYVARWTLRYGSVEGQYSLTETVPHSMWKKDHQKPDEPLPEDAVPTGGGETGADYWRDRYVDLLGVLKKENLKTIGLKKNVLELMSGLPSERDDGNP